MKQFERKVYSQAGQDGVLEHIFGVIGTTNQFFVEFGTVDGKHISNTANLRLHHGWSGLLMDACPTDPLVKKEFITAENIEGLLQNVYLVPFEFDYLSIDIDGNDWWVWSAIESNSPRVVSIEFNSHFPYDKSYTIAYNPKHIWDGTMYYGASLAALDKLATLKGYSLVHIVDNLDAFFVRNDCLHDLEPRTPKELLPNPVICHPAGESRPWMVV